MPRVVTRKARKDYPESGIKKGDTYYYTKLKTGPRSGVVKRSLTPFKPSQLTGSAFLSVWFGAQEVWEESARDGDAMRDAASDIRELGEEAQASFDNMPEGLQMGETGQRLEGRADQAEEVADGLESLADDWDALEDPDDAEGEPDEPEQGGRSDDDPEYIAEMDAYEEAKEAYEQAVSEFESEQERLRDEADSLLENVPE